MGHFCQAPTSWIANREYGTGLISRNSQYGGYSREELERLLSEGKLLALMERPELLVGSGVVEGGQVPVAT